MNPLLDNDYNKDDFYIYNANNDNNTINKLEKNIKIYQNSIKEIEKSLERNRAWKTILEWRIQKIKEMLYDKKTI